MIDTRFYEKRRAAGVTLILCFLFLATIENSQYCIIHKLSNHGVTYIHTEIVSTHIVYFADMALC